MKDESPVVCDCGCTFWSEGIRFFIKPHSLDCKVYKYALEESKKRGNMMEVWEAS
jgi:hypothetical protein